MSFRKSDEILKIETHHVEAGEEGERRVQWDGSAGFDIETERKLTKSLLRKLDTRMLPMLAVLFLFSFLDRTNIGNAKVSSLSEREGSTLTGRFSVSRQTSASMPPNTPPASPFSSPSISHPKYPPTSSSRKSRPASGSVSSP